jgi:hypothetical protein
MVKCVMAHVAIAISILAGCSRAEPSVSAQVKDEEPPPVESVEIARNKGYPEVLLLRYKSSTLHGYESELTVVPDSFTSIAQYLETMTEDERKKTKRIVVSGYHFSDIAGLEAFENLEEIEIRRSTLRDLAPLGRCKSLRIVIVGEARGFVLPDFSACHHLERVWLDVPFKDISNIYTIKTKDLFICLVGNDEALLETNMYIVKDYMKKTGISVGVMNAIIYYE